MPIYYYTTHYYQNQPVRVACDYDKNATYFNYRDTLYAMGYSHSNSDITRRFVASGGVFTDIRFTVLGRDNCSQVYHTVNEDNLKILVGIVSPERSVPFFEWATKGCINHPEPQMTKDSEAPSKTKLDQVNKLYEPLFKGKLTKGVETIPTIDVSNKNRNIFTAGEIATHYGVSAVNVNRFLTENGYQDRIYTKKNGTASFKLTKKGIDNGGVLVYRYAVYASNGYPCLMWPLRLFEDAFH